MRRTFRLLPYCEHCPIHPLYQRGASVSAVTCPRKLHSPIWNLICDLLQSNWSPEQVAGCVKRAGTVSVGFSEIYQRIRQDRAQGALLYTCPQHLGKPRSCKAKQYRPRL